MLNHILFVGRFQDALKLQIKNEAMRKLVEKNLVYHNANDKCKSILLPQIDNSGINDFLIACQNVQYIIQPPSHTNLL